MCNQNFPKTANWIIDLVIYSNLYFITVYVHSYHSLFRKVYFFNTHCGQRSRITGANTARNSNSGPRLLVRFNQGGCEPVISDLAYKYVNRYITVVYTVAHKLNYHYEINSKFSLKYIWNDLRPSKLETAKVTKNTFSVVGSFDKIYITGDLSVS